MEGKVEIDQIVGELEEFEELFCIKVEVREHEGGFKGFKMLELLQFEERFSIVLAKLIADFDSEGQFVQILENTSFFDEKIEAASV